MLDYYDTRRQEDLWEHAWCVIEEGEIWFGHGMSCRYPELHPEWRNDLKHPSEDSL